MMRSWEGVEKWKVGCWDDEKLGTLEVTKVRRWDDEKLRLGGGLFER